MSAEPDYLSKDLDIPSGQWVLRLEYPGHERPHFRTELRSNGEFRQFRDAAGDGHWQEVGLLHATPDDATSAYNAALALIGGFDLKNRARPDIGRDDDAVTQVTLATACGSRQVWFRGSEARDEESLAKGAEGLATLLTQIRKKNAEAREVEPPKERPENRWCVVVEDSTVNPNTNDAPHKYSLKVYDVSKGATRLLLDTQPQGNDKEQIKSFVASLREKFKLPAQGASVAAPPAPIKIVLRQITNNKRQVSWLNRNDADRHGIGKQADTLIATANRHLGPKGVKLP